MNMSVSRFIFCFLAVVIFTVSASQSMAQQRIQQIEVSGAERIDPTTVMSYLDLKVGEELNRQSLDRALKSLFSTGLFADVTIDQRGSTIIVNVVENPIINQIAFEGNDKLDDEELQPEIQLRPRQVFTRTKVQADVSRLYQIYRRNGRFSANIDPKIIRLDQNRVNLVFEIDEGPVTKIKSIRFVGNKRFDDDRLRSEISTKETTWYRFITADDRYDPDRLSYDQELLRRFYLAQGYADFELVSAIAELSSDRDHFFITFTLNEGKRYRVGKIDIASRIRDFDSSVLQETIKIESGDWYNADRVQESVDAMTDKLGDLQYAFVNVRPNVNRNRQDATIDLTFEISESPRVFVERINVNGNVRTLDKVVRREMLLVEGDPFNKSKLSRSEQRIRNLDFFETVNMNAKPGSAPDKTVVDVDVAEKSTGELSVGAGFSTSDGPLADVRIRERNLMGKGQDLLLSTTLAGERTQFDLSFTEPYFLNRDVSAGFDLFHVTRDLQSESSFDQRRTGGALRIGYPWSERWRQTVRFRGERNTIENVDGNASRFIRDQEGERDTLALSQRLTYDNRDSILFPTEGWYLWLDTEVTGFGGDSQYVSGKTGASFYYPVMDQVVLNLLGEVGAVEGYNDKTVAINERYYLGDSTLRGFDQAGVGPRDTSTDDALGGNRFYRGTAELSFPIGLPEELGVQGHAFGDAGSLYEVEVSDPSVVDENVIRASLGLGLSWRSPFGPVRVDFAVPVAKEDYDEEKNFRFNFGTRF
ncbi:MAG: outer membrane protein assembly factor BamA [Micavibrio sp.]|nr:outer membrane protein assembly factor BamA [Micavibrio sp.]